MKNYVIKNNDYFISEYIEEKDYFEVMYANGTKKFYCNTEKNKNHLNEQMMHQYENYTYNPIMAFSQKDILQENANTTQYDATTGGTSYGTRRSYVSHCPERRGHRGRTLRYSAR